MLSSLLRAIRTGVVRGGRELLAGVRAFFRGVAKGFENFFLMEKHHLIPARYQEEYNRATVDLIRANIKLACSLGIGITLLTGIFGYLLFSSSLGFRDMVIQPLVIAAAVAILILDRMAKTLSHLRLIGYLLSFAFTLAVGGYYLVSPHSAMMGISLFLIALLTSSFILPWTFRQTYLICLINLTVYVTIAHWIGRMANARYFFLDVMLLVAASIIACAIKRNDDLKRQKEFILNKELAQKTDIMEKDLRLARNVHQSLLPRSGSTGAVEIAVDYLPVHHIGGDFGKIYHHDDNALTVFICDVTGHGVSSALLVNRIHTEIETLLTRFPTPSALLAELDTFVKGSFRGYPMFLSAFCALLDFNDSQISYANYGHPPQLLLSRRQERILQMGPQTTIIGVEPELRKAASFEERLWFDRGDRLVLYTDGVVEAMGEGGEPFGMQRLMDFALENQRLGPKEFNGALIRRMREYRVGEASDDVLLFTVQTKPSSSGALSSDRRSKTKALSSAN